MTLYQSTSPALGSADNSTLLSACTVVACAVVSFGSKLSVTAKGVTPPPEKLPEEASTVASAGPTVVPDQVSNESDCAGPTGTLTDSR